MALIKTLKDFLTKTVIYPTTKTNAVYDDTVGRLDTYLHNTLGAEPIDDVEEETAELRDADTLGGRYTAEDLDAMPKSSAVEDYANVEPPMVDADALGGKKASEYATKSNLAQTNEKIYYPLTETVYKSALTNIPSKTAKMLQADIPKKDGYTILSIIPYGTNHNDTVIASMEFSNNIAKANVYNMASVSQDTLFYVRVLYIKSSLLVR